MEVTMYDELRQLAMAANTQAVGGLTYRPDMLAKMFQEFFGADDTAFTADADYIAAAAPSVVLALLDDVERLRAAYENPELEITLLRMRVSHLECMLSVCAEAAKSHTDAGVRRIVLACHEQSALASPPSPCGEEG